MAAKHATPPGGGVGDDPLPKAGAAGRSGGIDAASRPAGALGAGRSGGTSGAAGAPGAPGRGSRLLPSGPALEHGPLLLGLDDDGGEHPQGADYEDDESLVGRMWGCGCGWRGTVRDITGRHFHPRVGDGGGLRRKRLARNDRDSRDELETHLVRSSAAPADPPTLPRAVPRPSAAPTTASHLPTGPAEDGPRPRGRRRRLTVPRDTPLAIPPLFDVPSAPEINEAEAPSENGPSVELAVAEPTNPNTAQSSPDSGGVSTPPSRLAPAPAEDGSGERGSVERLTEAATRAEAARVELVAADAALNAAVAAAREDGLSWRTVGRATGIGYREAAARWGPPGGGPSL